MSLCSLTSPNPCSTTISITIKNGGQPKNYTSNYLQNSLNWPNNPSIGAAIAGAALSFTLLLSPPLSIAADSPLSDQSSLSSDSYCREDEREFGAEMELSAPKLKTNEGIVEEAWEIVNESFLDTGRSRWSPESWLRKKEDILSTSIKTRSKAHSVVQKMLASLGDPYTRFLSPEEFSKMARYDITGIGLNLREIPASNGSFKLKVLGLVLDGPAQTAGIRQGDEILSVDGEDVRGKSAFEVSSKLQGPSETFVTVEVKHGNCGPVQSVKVQRQMVARPPVFYRLEKIDNGATSVGYVRLKEFNALARKDIVTEQPRSSPEKTMARLTHGQRLDLLEQEIAEVPSRVGQEKFRSEVIYTAGRELSQNAFVAESPPLVTAPVMVLVNHNTASASEIVASALHDNCKAVLVGEKTYGKGLIQSVFELHDGSGVVVTIGKYITPHHLDINGNGIEPDFSNIPRTCHVDMKFC
uniref:PDZ domain-containing protein n=1 Tax=Chenopodium quinoa TaxID=63459 RepID=A0A803MV64_CHEQI